MPPANQQANVQQPSGAVSGARSGEDSGHDEQNIQVAERNAGTSKGTSMESDPLDSQWQHLEQQVRELIDLTSTLARENQALRNQQRNWTAERAKLIEKNELAKSRVESMITRLKALEHD